MQMRPRGDISKVAVRDGSAKRFENANFHDHTLTGVPSKRLYHVGARGHFHKSWEADGGAPLMSTG